MLTALGCQVEHDQAACVAWRSNACTTSSSSATRPSMPRVEQIVGVTRSCWPTGATRGPAGTGDASPAPVESPLLLRPAPPRTRLPRLSTCSIPTAAIGLRERDRRQHHGDAVRHQQHHGRRWPTGEAAQRRSSLPTRRTWRAATALHRVHGFLSAHPPLPSLAGGGSGACRVARDEGHRFVTGPRRCAPSPDAVSVAGIVTNA